jgi:hypothetical protein
MSMQILGAGSPLPFQRAEKVIEAVYELAKRSYCRAGMTMLDGALS